MPYQPIENYGLIGNLRTAALVGMDGSIDWLCLPSFDSPSVFAALLDDQKGGRFRIAPPGDDLRHKQHYWPNTNILITRFLHPDGIGLLLKGDWRNIIVTTLTAALGLGALAGGLTGWLLGKAHSLERGLLIVAGLVLVYPSPMQDLIGLGLFGIALSLQYRRRKLWRN